MVCFFPSHLTEVSSYSDTFSNNTIVWEIFNRETGSYLRFVEVLIYSDHAVVHATAYLSSHQKLTPVVSTGGVTGWAWGTNLLSNHSFARLSFCRVWPWVLFFLCGSIKGSLFLSALSFYNWITHPPCIVVGWARQSDHYLIFLYGFCRGRFFLYGTCCTSSVMLLFSRTF